MAQFSVKASFDGSELVNGFNDVKKELNDLSTTGKKVGTSLDSMLQQKNSTSNYSRQLGQIKQQLTDLSVNFSRLSDADKESDFGKAMSARIDELKNKALELKGVMDNVNSSLSSTDDGPKDYGEYWSNIQRNAEQTRAKFEGVQKVSAGVASGFAAVQGAAALLGIENEDLQKSLLKVQSAMAIAQGIGGLKDFFEGLQQLKAAFSFVTAATTADTVATSANTAAEIANTAAVSADTIATSSNTTAEISNTAATTADTVATSANTAAEIANTAATAANTIANAANSKSTSSSTASTAKAVVTNTVLTGVLAKLGKMFKGIGGSAAGFKTKLGGLLKVASKLPGWLKAVAVAVVAVGGALMYGIKKQKEHEQAVAEYNKRLEEQRKAEDERRNAVSTSVGTIVAKYKILQGQWAQLSSDQQRNKWISENQSAFNQLGISINSVNDAQRVFITNSDLVIKALKDQARARAMSTLYEEAIVKQYKADQTLTAEKQRAKQKYPEGYIPSDDEETAAGLNDSDFLTVTVENSLWDQKVNDKPRLEAKPTAAVDGSGSRKLQKNYLKEHQQAADQAAADVAKIEQAYTDAQKAAEASAAAVKAAGVKLNPGGGTTGGGAVVEDTNYNEESLKAAQKEVQVLQDKLDRMSPNDKAFEPTKQKLIEAQAKVTEIQEKMKEPVTPGSLKYWQQEVTTIQGQLDNMRPDDAAFESTLKRLTDAKAKVAEIQEKMKEPTELTFTAGSLKALQEEASNLQSQLESMHPDDAAFEPTLKKLNEVNKKVEEIQEKMKEPVTPMTNTEKLFKAYDDAQEKISNIVKQHELGIIDEAEAKKQIDEINKELQKLGLKPIIINLEPKILLNDKYTELTTKIDDVLRSYDIGAIGPKMAQKLINSINAEIENLGLKPIEVHLNTERAIQAIDGLAAHFEMLNTVGSAVSSINSVYEAFKNLPDAMDEAENGWERFMVGFETGMTILNAITSIFSMINGLITTFNTIQQISTLLKKKDAAASGEQAIADMAAAETSMTKGGAQMFEAATGAGKSLSWLPIVGPILAIAAIGAIMGVMMGVMNKSKFATGGIVPGSRIGDMDLVRVNGGEMILNNRQQSNLFRMLDQNRFQTPDLNPKTVNFRIQGDTLVGVIENYNRKKSRS